MPPARHHDQRRQRHHPERRSTATTVTAATTDTPFRWDGGYQDTEGDNYDHLGARYYDHAGHFTQPDSIKGQASQPKTVDQYAYASSDPINNTDLTGRSVCTVIEVAYTYATVQLSGPIGFGVATLGVAFTLGANASDCYQHPAQPKYPDYGASENGYGQ